MEPNEQLSSKQRAIDDAKTTNISILQECARRGIMAPPYVLTELIGKGSFGRVYKASNSVSGTTVAIKIISIEEKDSKEPRGANTFGDIVKEINTLKLLSDGNAKNISRILDTTLLGPSVWIVTEYCAGGSVLSLMKPTGGLPERWIVPLLREVAIAIFWVHKQGIIHRDIKCANVFVSQTGAVQLGDFGVAGIIESKSDKRKTITGTLQWMAPELFDSAVSYSTEVDIWAFGSMAYEVASGLPPNATSVIDVNSFGSYLKNNCPRLEGDQYSPELKDLIAYCLVGGPEQRPSIMQVQSHPYIENTETEFPTESLSKLVEAYKLWEAQGGSRQSLFSAVGAQGLGASNTMSMSSDTWNFDTIQPADESSLQTIYEAYQPDRDTQQPRRRRRPIPTNIKALKVPLERVFDQNTLTSYSDHSRAAYTRNPDPPSSDLPLRNKSQDDALRESLIDLDLCLDGGSLPQFVDLETTNRKAVSNHRDIASHRKTQDWSFSSAGPATVHGVDDDQPLGATDFQLPAAWNRASAMSLIDLDASLPDDAMSRPSTAKSDTTSNGSEAGITPFDLDSHSVVRNSMRPPREPSLYVSDEIGLHRHQSRDNTGAPDSKQFIPVPAITPSHFPPNPLPPHHRVMEGYASPSEVKEEMRRILASFEDHLQQCSNVFGSLPPRRIAQTYQLPLSLAQDDEDDKLM